MHLVSFVHNTTALWGVQKDDAVYSAASLAPTLDAWIQSGGASLDVLRTLVEGDKTPRFLIQDVRLTAPLQNPRKIVAIGLNYYDHCRETGHPIPSYPIAFAKFPSSIIGPGDSIRWRTDLTRMVDWEVELAIVMGRAARRVTEDKALDAVLGYTVANDVSAREIQHGDGQWVRGKSLDTFCPLGPVLVTADEIPDPQILDLRCLVNGTPMQDSNTREMIFCVDYLVSFLSQAFTLLPGDIILSGTPHGVGAARNPKVFLGDGDVVECEIEGIGRLRNVCAIEE